MTHKPAARRPEGDAAILVIDDDNEVRYSLRRVLESRGHVVATASNGAEGLEAARKRPFALVFLDYRMPGMNGLETLQRLRSLDSRTKVVLMTAFGTTNTAIEAMKWGAFDYVLKPFDPDQVFRLVDQAMEAWRGGQAAAEGVDKASVSIDDLKEDMVGGSPAMREVFKTIGQVARSNVTVMITGESGTGKELVARSLWRHSTRAERPFVAVNCAAIPDNLIESELFGHEKGAFTGAIKDRAGRFEQCDGGTLFLDEIGDMSLSTQTKILRVLQERELQRVGGSALIPVDVRLIAATNRDLERMVAEKTFREDLYYRLNVVRLRIPSLRERLEDIPELVSFMLNRLAKRRIIPERRFSKEALERLMAHSWPGNVRELENVVTRAAVMAQGEMILLQDISGVFRDMAPVVPVAAAAATPSSPAPAVAAAAPAIPGPAAPKGADSVRPAAASAAAGLGEADLGQLLDDFHVLLRKRVSEPLLPFLEQELTKRVLRETNGNQAKAAAILGITRATLRKRIAGGLK